MLTRVFSQEDQQAFAGLSGDHNPVHVDPLVARRTLFGRPIVHGIHLVLWALTVTLDAPVRLSRLRVTFSSSVGVGEPVTVQVVSRDVQRLDLRLECRGGVCVTVKAELAPYQAGSVQLAPVPQGRCATWLMADLIPHYRAGRVPISLDMSALAGLLPALADPLLPVDQVAILLATTRVVGMECPGQHSIFAMLDLTFTDPPPAVEPALDWALRRYEDRFAQAEIAVTAPGATGSVTAFLRPPAQDQPRAAALRGQVAADAYAGRRALIIGGSRGVGEVAAKLLGLGGADICLTYRHGIDDAARVVADIVGCGGTARHFQLDVTAPADGLVGQMDSNWFPTHLYYFATPPMFTGSKGRFSEMVAASFMEVYVHGLMRTYQALRMMAPRSPLHLFYPSSTMVEELPPHMGEYAMAKMAGETLCRFLASTDRHLSIRIDRLPRLATDQTASLFAVSNEDIVATVTNLLAD